MADSVLVLGSGPIRIGQGVEFDYSCVHCIYALRRLGYRALMVNNNPETVSTDFDTADALYFEPVTFDDVMGIVERERPLGVVVQFGGQTALNLAAPLALAGVRILGTSSDSIGLAEDRDRCDALLARLGINRPAGQAVRTIEEAREAAGRLGYPVLVRPSFVLGGRAMEIVDDASELDDLYRHADAANPGGPVLIDRYIEGVEAELDVVSDGRDTLVPGVMEHIERAGIHSGDSMTVYPPVHLDRAIQSRMAEIASRLAIAIEVRGLMNVQFVVTGDEVQVLEVNPRASRTVPYISKVTGLPMVALATHAAMGGQLSDCGYGTGVWCAEPGRVGRWSGQEAWRPRIEGGCVPFEEFSRGEGRASRLVAVKAPVFSFQKLAKVEPSLGPEMKSTGEVLGIDRTFEAALYKALIASGVTFKPHGQIILTVNDEDKPAAVEIARRLVEAGHSLAATSGTHRALVDAGVPADLLNKMKEGSPNIRERLFQGETSLMINTPKTGSESTEDAAMIRRTCIEMGVACITSIDTAGAIATAIEAFANPALAQCRTVGEYAAGVDTEPQETLQVR